jgi:hypothetical protein
MRILPFVLLAGALSLSQAAAAQTAPGQPAAPAAPAASEPNAGSTDAPTGAAAAPSIPTRQITVSELTTESLKGQNGENLGDITRVVENAADKKTYLVVSRGGILGFFGTEYLVPLDRVAIADDGAVAANMTPAQLESGPTVSEEAHRALNETQTVAIREQR